MIILEFFKSDNWRDIQTRFLATLGLSGVGTVANSMTITPEQSEQLFRLDVMVKTFAIGSYILSGIVALTVVIRFIYWFLDRHKNKN